MDAIERIEPGTEEWIKYFPDHIMRYEFASDIIKNVGADDLILDAACGVGYGTKFLSEKNNAQFTGIDISSHAISIASNQFSAPNIKYVLGNCELFDGFSEDSLFSYIISFETFEHLSNPRVFLQNAFKFLVPNGRAVISTPNKMVTSPDGIVKWKYHETEYTPSDFVKLVESAGFKNVEIYGQGLSYYGRMRSYFTEQLLNLNRHISFNPSIRFGNFIKKLLGKKIKPFNILEKGEIEDFNIIKYNSFKEIEEMGKEGPFVQIIIATK